MINFSFIIALTEGCEFDDSTITITAGGTGAIADVWPARWRVCGLIRSPSVNTERRSVVVQSTSPPSTPAHIAKAGDDDRWCLYLSPGNYLANVQISDIDRRDGLQYVLFSLKLYLILF